MTNVSKLLPSSLEGLPGRSFIVITTCVVLTFFVGFLDYASCCEMDFYLFYFVPIAISAWFVGRRAAFSIVFMSVVTSLFADMLINYHPLSWLTTLWNTAIRVITFSIVALTMSIVRNAHLELRRYRDHLEQLVQERTRELEDTLAKVKVLRGLIPICAWCKKIRDDQGYWQQIEAYIRDHSEADFSHAICPACAQKVREEIRDSIP